jgi:hypothetical protein
MRYYVVSPTGNVAGPVTVLFTLTVIPLLVLEPCFAARTLQILPGVVKPLYERPAI